MKLNNIVFGVVLVLVVILLFIAGVVYVEKQQQSREDKLIELYLKHYTSRNIADTIRVPVYYKVPEVRIIEKPVIVKEYLKDTLARSELEQKTLIMYQKHKLDLFNRPRSFSITTIDTAGKVAESFYKIPILTKEIKISSSGQVEYKKRKLTGLKIATGIIAGTLTYTYIRIYNSRN